MNIQTRTLKDNEKVRSGKNEQTIFVVESDRHGRENLNVFLKQNSEVIWKKINHYGAVLLRGFKVNSEREFETAVGSIEGFMPMNDYFMAEPGRTLVEGCKYVFYSNKNYKTGGSLVFGGFHTENYYSCDVPRFISFCCLKRSWYGGETGLVNLGKVFDDLDVQVKDKLRNKTFLIGAVLISGVAKRYGMPEAQIRDLCLEFGLKVHNNAEGKEKISIYKPCVVNHPQNNIPVLMGNLSSELQGLDAAVLNEFRSSYRGLKWKLHRVAWQHPNLGTLSELKFKDAVLFALGLIKSSMARKEKPKNEGTTPNKVASDRLDGAFSPEDLNSLAKSIRSNFISFGWKKGDILLVDNLQMAHAGMPGLGPRIIRAILSNPIPMNYLPESPGYQEIKMDSNYKSLVNIIMDQKNRKNVISSL